MLSESHLVNIRYVSERRQFIASFPRTPFMRIWANSIICRNALVHVSLVDERVRYLVDCALGTGGFVVRGIRCQLPDEKFLKKIDRGRFANSD